ncbi:MAG: FAD-binding oxidoreductase, partial [Bacteroidota bacterium]|nr:FAD-binding oxidoreductase [Bacteroidota bacterium]
MAVTAEGTDRVQAGMAALAARIGDSVRTDTFERALYSTDASIYQVQPQGVVIPKHRDEMQAVMEIATEYGIPVTARAAGSSLAGQAVGPGLIVDVTKHLDRILDLDRENRRVTVEPGVVLDHLNRFLRDEGLLFGPDPASSNRAAMGGIVSNNSTGSHSICYGMTADHVHAMEVILADGSRTVLGNLEATAFRERGNRSGLEGAVYRGMEALLSDPAALDIIRRDTPRHWRRCGGYNLDRLTQNGVSFKLPHEPGRNLARLLCGAEGTLGLIETITLDLVPLPRQTGLAIVHFDDIVQALETVQVILEVDPSAVELLDHLGMSMCRQSPMWRRKLKEFVEGDPNAVLITEFQGETEAEIADRVEKLKAHLRSAGAPSGAIVPVLDASGQQDVWSVRKMGLGFLMRVRVDHKPLPFIEDAAEPVEHLDSYVTG